MSRRPLWAAGLTAALAIALPGGSAKAAPPLGLDDCGPAHGVHQCQGISETWDGIPLDTTVTLPSSGARRLPLVVEIHGFGNSKYEYLDPASTAYTDNAYAWARDGYAVLTYTARGLWGSCGTPEARAARPEACAAGYIRLADHRYEVRDTQELVGRLVDGGIVDPRRIGVTGDSYGGGQSFALAALRDRVMLPDGRLVPWRSPGGTPLRIAAAAPVIPWTDLIYAIAPNGRTLTYTVTPPGVNAAPVGIAKQSFASGIFAAAQFAAGPGQPVGEPFVPGRPMGFLAPPGYDPEADVTTWLTRATAGEPYTDPEARAVVKTLRRYHSAYYVPAKRPPPLLVAAGFTDDLFPVDEGLRFVNRAEHRWPGLPVSLFLGDFGHQRAGNPPRQRTHLLAAIHRWFDRYLRGRGPRLRGGVVAYSQTCPRGSRSSPPVRAADFARLARGEVRRTFRKPRAVSSNGRDPGGAAVDPVAGGGDACVAVPDRRVPETATYELAVRGPRAFTLVGAPTLLARLQVEGPPGAAQLAGRLWDVAPLGGRTLVARGFYRPTDGRNIWQLHPGAWRFRPGHAVQLELLGSDAPFGRPSNSAFAVEVKRLELRLPLRQRPDCQAVLPPRPPALPRGQRLAPGVREALDAASGRGCPGR
jgi:hypothetical protein